MGVWRERMRGARRRRLRAPDRQRGPRGGRLAPAHPRPALRAAASCPPPWRASASASPPTPTAPRAATCSRTWCRRRSAAASAWWRSTPRPCCSARSPRACPFQMQIVPRRPARAVRGRRPAGRGAAPRGARAGCARALGGAAAAQHVGAHRAARRRALLLAHRRPAAPGPAGRPRAGHRRAPERARPRAAAERLREAPLRASFRAAVPPSERPDPRCTSPSRRRSRCPTAAGPRRCSSTSGDECQRDRRGPRRGRRARLGSPSARWGGRTYLPVTAPAADGGELFGYVSWRREHEGAQAADFEAAGELHRGHRRGEPRLEARPLRPGDRPLARRRGAARHDHAGVGRGAGAQRRGGHRRAGPTTTDQCELVDDRFTLVSLDRFTGDYVEVRLYGPKGAELAAEPLYEED